MRYTDIVDRKKLWEYIMKNIPIYENEDNTQLPSIGLLECEKMSVFLALMFVAGIYGAYTYNIRGGVFCNAQTANFVLFSMALGKGEFAHAAYYFIPMTAYFLGSVISEAIAGPVRKHSPVRWDTVLIGIETAVVIMLGFLPESAPDRIAQVTVNFICSMQYNTFRQAERVPMATVFCTNHVRQTGIYTVKAVKERSRKHAVRLLRHVGMLAAFVLGGVISTLLCLRLGGRAIWAAAIPLLMIFADLAYADLKTEKNAHDRIPGGH